MSTLFYREEGEEKERYLAFLMGKKKNTIIVEVIHDTHLTTDRPTDWLNERTNESDRKLIERFRGHCCKFSAHTPKIILLLFNRVSRYSCMKWLNMNLWMILRMQPLKSNDVQCVGLLWFHHTQQKTRFTSHKIY